MLAIKQTKTEKPFLPSCLCFDVHSELEWLMHDDKRSVKYKVCLIQIKYRLPSPIILILCTNIIVTDQLLYWNNGERINFLPMIYFLYKKQDWYLELETFRVNIWWKVIAKLFIFNLNRKEHLKENNVSYLNSIFDRHRNAKTVELCNWRCVGCHFLNTS